MMYTSTRYIYYKLLLKTKSCKVFYFAQDALPGGEVCQLTEDRNNNSAAGSEGSGQPLLGTVLVEEQVGDNSSGSESDDESDGTSSNAGNIFLIQI